MSLSRTLMLLLCCGLGAAAQAQTQPELDRTPIAATTASGDKVWLHPNGRWEFVETKQAEAAQKTAGQYPENKTRPVDAQGGLFGLGRTVMPGDKDYNRGSMSPKTR